MATSYYWLNKQPTCKFRETVKIDIINLLEKFSRYGNNVSFSSFKMLWKNLKYNMLIHSFPMKMHDKYCFNLITEVALELLYYNDVAEISKVVCTNVINQETRILKDSIWNIGILYFLYCFHMLYSQFKLKSHKNCQSNQSIHIRISLKHYKEIEYCLERWKLIENGHQAIRLWILMLSQNMLEFSFYSHGIGLNRISAYVHNVVENTKRVQLKDIIQDNEFIAGIIVNNKHNTEETNNARTPTSVSVTVASYLPYQHTVNSNILSTEADRLYSYTDTWDIDKATKSLNVHYPISADTITNTTTNTNIDNSISSRIIGEPLDPNFGNDNDHSELSQLYISSLDELLPEKISDNSNAYIIGYDRTAKNNSTVKAINAMVYDYSMLEALEGNLSQFENENTDIKDSAVSVSGYNSSIGSISAPTNKTKIAKPGKKLKSTIKARNAIVYDYSMLEALEGNLNQFENENTASSINSNSYGSDIQTGNSKTKAAKISSKKKGTGTANVNTATASNNRVPSKRKKPESASDRNNSLLEPDSNKKPIRDRKVAKSVTISGNTISMSFLEDLERMTNQANSSSNC